ncbi:MAG: spondin domain-containing protein [Acidobacteria bacterium]|nr:spondin domain-containing protein [Acidobacteriota bacterium]
MKITTQLITSVFSTAFIALGDVQAETPQSVNYQVSFERTWSSETHPEDFPLLAHFSPVIGVTHDARYSPFRVGSTATSGIESLCEEGKHQPLDGEIRSAVEGGIAGMIIETADPIRDAPGQATANIEVDAEHPLVSIGAMVAPSPDWCAVAADVSLFEGGQWVDKKTVLLYTWDVGTDAGSSYRAFDSEMDPRATIQLSDAPYFVNDGGRVPVGQVTFVRQ